MAHQDRQEAQHVVPVLLEAQDEIVPDAPRLAAVALGTTEWGLLFMEGDPLGQDGVVASLDAGNEASSERHAKLAGKVCRVAGAPQQDLHLARPVFLLDVDQRLQLAQVMSLAQGVQHVQSSCSKASSDHAR